MSTFKPTASQAAAIGARGGAVLVSAGAGSGKTRVLTERLMAYLTDPEAQADLDSFLIITFTNAAAGELRGRIMEALAEAQAADPANRRLRRQSALCRRAAIGTIHSFCGNLLRENSHLIPGLSPDFLIADDRAQAMKPGALERVLEDRYEKPERYPGFLLLVDTVGAGQNDRGLEQLVLELHRKIQCHTRPESWAEEQIRRLRSPAADAGETVWGREILGFAGETAGYWSRELDRVLQALEAEEKIGAAYRDSLAETAEAVRALCRCLDRGWDRARACFPVPFPKLKALRNSPDPSLSDWVKARREACKKAMGRLEKMFHGDSRTLLRDMDAAAPAMEALLRLTLDFDREYAKEKRRAGIVDYADLEHMAAQLLTDEDGSPTEAARQVSRRYTEIMVDEYQDVSQVQDTIFRAVSREGKNLFLVGDVKQSIYRFRLADPEIFTRKYREYKDDPAPGEPRRILLQENFRSRREILDAVNAVFSLCMSRRLGDLDYDEAAALKPGAPYEGEVPRPELLLLRAAGEEGDERRPEKRTLEAAAVAAKIRELVGSGVRIRDRDGDRPLGYGDVAILLRSANAVGDVYRRELVRQGIPVAAGQGGGFFASVEVSTLVSVLELIDNPRQDIPLIAVLRSPAVGFSADELSAIRAQTPKGDFYTALCARGETDEKCRRFLEQLEALRAAAPDLSAAELTWRVLERFDLLAVCAAMADGERRKARLMAMTALADQFETTGYRGLHRFVLWLRQRAADGEREPALGAEAASAVRILSVHKSKGLEFPVVFLCDGAHQFNSSDSKAKVLIHPELGLGPKLTNLELRHEYPTLARNAIRLRLDREMLSEEMRLLYVALTRARERLFITAALKDPEKALAEAEPELSVPLDPEVLARAAAPVDWLLRAALADRQEHLRLQILQPAGEEEDREEAAPAAQADGALTEQLRRRLAFQYPYAAAEELPSKVTVTELKDRAEPDEDAQSLRPAESRPFRLPDFTRKDRPVTGAERGTATHLVLQHMDFARTADAGQIQSEIERLRRQRFLSDREAAAVDAGAIEKLFRSPLGARLLRAKKLRREFRFSLLCGAEEVFGKAEGDRLLMQGVVDCFFEEDGQLVVLDYKTDRIAGPEALRERTEFYAGQLRSYALALERICGKPVKECVLYFLSAGRAVSLPIR